MMIKLNKKFKTVNIFIIVILGLFTISTLYYLYHRQRSQSWVYVTLSLVRPSNTPLNIVYNSVPYWVGNAISVGDREQNLLGSVGVIVLDKESYDWINFGQVVNLVLKVNSTKDRTGVNLYKNNPLLVGSLMDLKLNRVQAQGIVIDISDTLIPKKTDKLEITLRAKQVEPWIAENIKVDEELKDNKGNVVAKIKSFKSTVGDTPVNIDNRTNTIVWDTSRSNLDVIVDLTCTVIDNECYFAQTEKVKTNENIFLPFTSVSLNYPIAKVKPQ